MIVNIEQRDGTIIISHINKEGDMAFMKFNIDEKQKFNYVYSKNERYSLPNVKSWDNKPVSKVPAQFLTRSRIQELFCDTDQTSISKLLQNNVPKLYACDIEVDVTEDGFPEASAANNRINSFSWSHYPDVISFGLKPLSGEECADIENQINEHIKKSGKKYNFIYKQFNNEADMIYDFLYNYARHAPLITGWNFWTYDWLYIMNRAKRLNMDISWMSPTRQWKEHRFMERNKKIPVMLPQHKLIVDYMSIYKKWDRKIDIKENSTLDFVAESALGIRKVKYPGTFQELYAKDFNKYIFYNAIDTILVEMIDGKLKTMNTFLGLANATRVEAMEAFSPIAMLEAVLAQYAYNEHKVFPKVNKKSEYANYEGAFVFEPIPDLYDWIATLDFRSLYPTIIRQFLISIENFLFKDKNYKPKANEIKTSSGAVFDASYMPLLPTVLTDFFNKRVDAKDISIKAEEEANELKKILEKRKSINKELLS